MVCVLRGFRLYLIRTNKKSMKKLYLLASAYFFFITSSAQLAVSPGSSAAVLVTTLLDPSIILVGTPVITCPTNSRGTFNAAGVDAAKISGIGTGIILSNGLVADAASKSGTFASTSTGGGTDDPDLMAINSGKGNQDLCKLEFDINVNFDTLTIAYVFGTDEYPNYTPPTYTSDTYTDVFGFFVSGPGITGNQNMSLVPGTGTKVSSWTINTVSNPAYFIDNTPAGNPIVYGGLTKLLTAKIKVTAGSTYHIKIAIADVGTGLTGRDRGYDSGVFIKANSIKSAVPIELLSFACKKVDNYNLIEWSTATELNNKKVEILRSGDGRNFEAISTFEGNGNSSSVKKYTYKDEKPLPGTSYYRLKQVDNDGKVQYSNIMSVENRIGKTIQIDKVFPNPIQDQMVSTIYMPVNGQLNAEIYDMTGKKVYYEVFPVNEGLNEIIINTQSLEKGVYMLKVSGEMLEGAFQRIVK